MLYNWRNGDCPPARLFVDGVECESSLFWLDTDTGEYEEVIEDENGLLVLSPDGESVVTRRGVFEGEVSVVFCCEEPDFEW